MVDSLIRGPGTPIFIRLEVWNRTLEPMFLVDADGRRLDVPACEHSVATTFRVNDVRVRTEEGYFLGFGGGTGETQYLVLVADPAEMSREEFPPVAVPPCEGFPMDQPGV